MLHVKGTDHVDTGVEQFQNILITLFVAAKRRIGVSQLIDDGDLRAPFQHGIHVHLLDGHTAVFDPAAAELPRDRRSARQCRPIVRLDESQYDVDAPLL